jgi:hypothetical protein
MKLRLMCSYWIMSALTNDIFVLARYAGLYKAIQSAGAAASYAIDATAQPVRYTSIDLVGNADPKLLNEQLSAWLLLIVSLIGASLVVWDVKDTNYDVEEVIHVGDTAVGADGKLHIAGETVDEKDVEAYQTTQVNEVVNRRD